MPRIKGGAVIEERSPLKDAIDYRHISLGFTGAGDHARTTPTPIVCMIYSSHTLRNEVHEPLFCGAMAPPSSLEDMETVCYRPMNR